MTIFDDCAVMISVHPRPCGAIISGRKTIEVRKTRPKLNTPFKCYIYCTTNELLTKSYYNGKIYVASNRYKEPLEKNGNITLSGKVIGEFVCDSFVTDRTFGHDALFNAAACISEVEAAAYCLNSPMYGWHISQLRIYDTPKALNEFHRPCTPACNFSEECGGVQDGEHCLFPLQRPPQSWCYVQRKESAA